MKPVTMPAERTVEATDPESVPPARLPDIEAERQEAAVRLIAIRAVERGAVQKPEELAGLLRMLRKAPPQTVVEIGTDQGGSLYACAQVADPEATIVSIDKPFGNYTDRPRRRIPRKVRSYMQPDQSFHALALDSQLTSTRDRVERILSGRPIDFLMIDGDHTYEGVRRDWELYEPLVSEGGIIAFHDIVRHHPATLCEVEQLWREIAPDRDSLEILHEPERSDGWGPWAGIGVIVK